jgi:hypothetical protein
VAGDAAALSRAFAVVAGMAITSTGYLAGTLRLRFGRLWHGSRTSNLRPALTEAPLP